MLGRGTVTLNDIYHNNTLKSFEGKSAIIWCSQETILQIHTTASLTIGFLEEVLRCVSQGAKALVFYSMMIQSVGDGALRDPKLTWEGDITLTLEEDEWEAIWLTLQMR